MSEPTILITGASGFIGSALAAAFLERGARVLCPARGDDADKRVRARVEASGVGLGTPLAAAALSRLEVLPFDLARLAEDKRIEDVTAAWHCAAHMTFSRKKLQEALDF